MYAFDFYYAHHHLARPGNQALERMITDVGDSDPDLLEMIKNPRAIQSAMALEAGGKFWAKVVYRPQAFEVPFALKAMIEQFCFANLPGEAVLLQVDLDSDGQNEYALIQINERGIVRALYFPETDDGWQQGNLSYSCKTFRERT